METTVIEQELRINAYPALFGTSKYKNMPLFAYAESLFYMGMDQMISSYNGGYFDFVKITKFDENIDIVSNGFMPLITTSKHVEIETPFGMKATLSYQSCCLIVWLFVLEQIACSIDNSDVSETIYKTIQDLKCYYSVLTNENGSRLFSDDDCAAMHTLLD